MTAKKWSASEVCYLRTKNATLTDAEIARDLGRTLQQVWMKKCRLGLSRNLHINWTAAEEAFLRDNYDRMKRAEIAEALGRDVPSIIGKARRLRLRKSAGRPRVSDAVNPDAAENQPTRRDPTPEEIRERCEVERANRTFVYSPRGEGSQQAGPPPSRLAVRELRSRVVFTRRGFTAEL